MIKVNEKIYNQIKKDFELAELKRQKLHAECRKLTMEGAPQSEIDKKVAEYNEAELRLLEIEADWMEYGQKFEQVRAQRKIDTKGMDYYESIEYSQKYQEYKDAFKDYQKDMAEKYLSKKKRNKGTIFKRIVATVAAIATIGLAGLGVNHLAGNPLNINVNKKAEQSVDESYNENNTTENIDKSSDNKDLTELELGEPGTYLDATDEDQVIARANWYFENYFDKEYKDLSESKKELASKENLADNMAIISGASMVFKEADVEELNNYQNNLGQMFASYLSLDENEKVGFVPSQYLYIDGSLEQKAAAQVDEIMEPLVEAINDKDNEKVKEYAEDFGELMLKQYYHLDFSNDDTIPVRGICSNTSKYHLWKLAYKEYTNKIMPYCINNDINVCVDFCIDHETGETNQISLAALMATLEKIPMDQWDAVLARAGITAEEVEELGNKYSGETMSNMFISDARESLRNKYSTLNLK